MTSPCRRRHQPSAVQSIRSHLAAPSHTPLTPSQSSSHPFTIHATPSSRAPQTRSRSRLLRSSAATQSKSKISVYDENLAGSSATKGGTQKSLRSRAPKGDKENMMNVLEQRKRVDSGAGGKRKAVDETDEGGKKMKVESGAKRMPGQVLSTKASLESLNGQTEQKTMGVSLARTPVRSMQSAPPTPAREILRQGMRRAEGSNAAGSATNLDKTSPLDSPPSGIIIRPPTPPRVRERHSAVADDAMDEDSFEAAPAGLVARPPTPPRMRERPSQAGLAPTPGRAMPSGAVPRSPNGMLGVVASTTPVTSPLRHANLAAAPATPHFAPTPSRLRSSAAPSAVIPQPSASAATVPGTSTPASPTPRGVVSPLTGRKIADAAKAARVQQPTLDGFFVKPPVNKETMTPMEVDTVHAGLAEVKEDVEMMEADEKPVVVVPQTAVPPTPISAPTPSVVQPKDQLQLHKTASTRSLMAPPSRIPVSTRPLPTAAAAAALTASNSSTTDKAVAPSPTVKKHAMGLGVGALAERRPSSRPNMVSSSTGGANAPGPSSSPVKRQPSYPSSLGSGPLARPTNRMVSNPVLPPRSASSSHPPVAFRKETLPAASTSSTSGPSQRSVSAPVPRPRLSLSTSRREGMSDATSQSLAGLSEALEKLKAKKRLSGGEQAPVSATAERRMSVVPSLTITEPAPRSLTDRPSNLSASTSASSSSGAPRLSLAGHRPRSSIAMGAGDMSFSASAGGDGATGETGAGDKSILGMLSSRGGRKCFAGVVAYVDVRTSEGTDSGQVFADILKAAGAKVLTRPSPSCTHIIYKSGRPATLNWYRRQEDEKPLIVGIKWVMDSKKAGKKQDEERYAVDVSDESVFDKRRKSMEPKSLAASQGAGPSSYKKSALLAVADARRKSMAYAPKLPSPLKKAHKLPSTDDDA
ncbi:hypothetical protein IAT38_002520 [Cryptococcus sp. DSM 104549]